MKVEKDRVVSIDYSIRLLGGQVVESSDGDLPLTYLHGRMQIIPGIERALDGTEPGTELEVEVAPTDGYGERDPDGVFLVPRASFPADEEIAEGMTFSAIRPDGEPVIFRVMRADNDVVLVDTNHPLAGETLRISIAVREVRDATDDEMSHGRVRQPTDEAPLLS